MPSPTLTLSDRPPGNQDLAKIEPPKTGKLRRNSVSRCMSDCYYSRWKFQSIHELKPVILGISSVPVPASRWFLSLSCSCLLSKSISAEVVCKPWESYGTKCSGRKLVVRASLQLKPKTESFRP
ncbi:hypothetical protein GUJ93_ZPchr0006g42451 [Zizania palustris]|uniref:Uncharacterized protein n=1 Tax=Zizania palustris TaxID=103762 RepID=A0A8J5VJK8_ZIZPA|nr:hypothetical protein GUJ93_ZPchr0006g42451 [Zizania palustris]